MKNMIIRSTSISELHEGMGLGKPAHPLITIVDTENLSYGEELIGMKVTLNYITEEHIDYGHYSF